MKRVVQENRNACNFFRLRRRKLYFLLFSTVFLPQFSVITKRSAVKVLQFRPPKAAGNFIVFSQISKANRPKYGILTLLNTPLVSLLRKTERVLLEIHVIRFSANRRPAPSRQGLRTYAAPTQTPAIFRKRTANFHRFKFRITVSRVYGLAPVA